MSKQLLRVPAGFGKGLRGVDASSTELVVNLIRLGSRLEDSVASNLRPADISPAAMNVLMVLRQAKASLCPSEISARLVRTRGTVTGVLDSLERRGLIARQQDAHDRRMIRIELTAAGRALLDRVMPTLWSHEATLLQHLTVKEKATLLRLVARTLEGPLADDG